MSSLLIVEHPDYTQGAQTRPTVTSLGLARTDPDPAVSLDVAGNLVLGSGGTVACAGFSGLLSATLAATPLNGNRLLAERFCRWNQYVTSRAWREDAYVDQPAWWAQWMVGGNDGPAAGTLSWTTLAGAVTFAGNKFVGAVLLPDGRALAVPSGPGGVGVFSYLDDSWVSYGTVSGTSRGGCVMPDGRALLAPYGAETVNTFSYKTNAVTTVDALAGYAWIATADKFACATLLPDGRAYLPNLNAAVPSAVYDYATDTVTTVAGNAQSSSVQLLPTGQAMTFGLGTLGFFDYRTDTFTTQTGPARSGVAGSCLLPDGRVLWAYTNGGAQLAMTYDFRTRSYTTTSVWVAPSAEAFRSLVQLPDGRALGIPYTGSALVVFDYRDDSWTSYAGPGVAYWGGSVMPDGRVLLVPSATALDAAVVSVAGVDRAPSLDACYHPCFNQNP